MDNVIIKSAITTVLGLLKKVVPIARTLRRQNKAIDNAVAEIIPLLDNYQFEGFFNWICSLKIDSFASLNFRSLDESIEFLSAGLKNRLIYLDVDDDKQKRIIEVFVTAILKYAKEDKPGEYVAHLVDEILVKQNEIIKLIKEKNISFDTYYSLEKEWRSQTEPSIGVGFFKIEEENIVKKISNFIGKNHSFFVSHYCAEEAVLMLISTINELYPEKRIFIINNVETWKYFENKRYDNCVFIYRYKINGEIILNEILNSTCIYLLDIDEKPQNKKEIIQFHKWYKNTLDEKFKRWGFSTEERVKIVRQTSGLFYQIKSYLWRGVFPLYDEFNEYKDTIKLLLVFPSFRESDLQYLASFIGDYEKLKKEIEVLTSGENPILIMPKNGFKVVNHVSDSYALWCKYGHLISNDEDYLFSKKGCLLDNKTSNELKRGYLNSLSFYACVCKSRSQINVDRIVDESLKSFASNWECNFGGLSLYEFVEPSPKSVINYIKENKGNLSQLFIEPKEKNKFFSPTRYVKVTTALEKIVSYKEYAIQGFNLASYFAGIEQLDNSNYSPKAKDVLELLYIPWINYSGLSTEQRIKVGTDIYNSNKELSGFILNCLSATSGPMMSVGYNIRSSNEDFNVSINDFHRIIKHFLELIIRDSSPIKLTSYLKKIDHFDIEDETLNFILKKIITGMNDFDDGDRYKIVEDIRAFVYDCKFFQRNIFKNKKSFLDKLTIIVENNKYRNDLYEHLFIFAHSKYHFPLLYPVSFDSEDSTTINLNLVEELFNKHLEVILNKKYDLDSLIKIVIETKNINNAYDVFLSLNSNIAYEKRVLSILIDNNLPQVAFAYVVNRNEFRGDNLIKAIKESDNPIYQSRILRFCNISLPLLDFIKTLSIDTQKDYWSTPLHLKLNDIVIFNRIEKELLEFKSYSNWVALLDENKFLIGIDTSISHLYENVEILRKYSHGVIDDYHIANVLDECLKLDNNLDLLEKAALVEIAISERMREELLCLKKYCSLSPKIYTDLFLLINSKNKVDKAHYAFVYTLLNYRLIFCPGLCNGYFESNIFNKWINNFIFSVKNECEQNDIDYSLGKLFGYSVDIHKEIPIPETICKYFEEHYSKQLADGMAMSIYQPTGIEVRTIGNGSDRFALSDKYLKCSKNLENEGYFNLAEVFARVSNWFYADGESEAEDAINGRQ